MRLDDCGDCGCQLGGNKVDKKDPSVNCGSADGNWHADDVSIGCTAGDGGSGLAVAGDASFSLSTTVAAGTEDSNASTGSHSVSDAVGHTVTAGPISGNKIDKKAPSVSCGTADGLWHASDVLDRMQRIRRRLRSRYRSRCELQPHDIGGRRDREPERVDWQPCGCGCRRQQLYSRPRSAATRSTRRRPRSPATRPTATGTLTISPWTARQPMEAPGLRLRTTRSQPTSLAAPRLTRP